jgi:hypothetical protein
MVLHMIQRMLVAHLHELLGNVEQAQKKQRKAYATKKRVHHV